MSQLSVHAKMQKPCKSKHPAFTKTNPHEPIKMTGTIVHPGTTGRTRIALPKVSPRRRLTD
jgi:hypothetical protein